MPRTIAFSAGLALLVAWNWGRLEHPRPSIGPVLLMIALGIAPALLPPLPRLFVRRSVVVAAAGVVAVLIAAAVALHARPYELGRITMRARNGFLDFYDVLVPFDGRAHPLMHGVVLLAVCVFSLLCALAVAARRPVAAVVALAAGAGWPATIMPGSDDLGRGAFLLAASIALVAWLRPEGRRAPPQVLAGTALVVAALIVSSSSAVAKGQFLDWQNWDVSTKSGKQVSVEYVWRANYDGIRWPKKRTRVFTVSAPRQSTYWRATTLDAFVNDRWDEDLVALSATALPNPVDLSGDPLLPEQARDPARWQLAEVNVDALRDAHLVGPGQPVAYDAGSVENVQYEQSGIALASSPLSRGDEYKVWGYTPRPRPAQLARSRAEYPPEIYDGWYLGLGHGRVVPPFGTQEHKRWVSEYFENSWDGPSYRPLYVAGERIAGKAKNPYAAAVALEAWFRSSGGFTYDERPPRARAIPPLVQFVRTKRGYCQHFAGAMALMLRYLGIPARVAAGFTSGTYDTDRKRWTVYDRNAHTWVEVWFKGYGWLPFDPTPGRGTLGGPYTSSSLLFDAAGAVKVLSESALQGRRLLRAQLGNPGNDARQNAQDRRESAANQGGARQVRDDRGFSLGAVVALAALALIVLFVLAKLARRRARNLTRDPRRSAAACRHEVVEFLLDQGIVVPASAGPRELGRLLAVKAGIEATDFAETLGLARYGPLTSAPRAARETRRELRRVRARLRRVFSPGDRLRGLFSFRSLLTARQA
jgi:transglutaminase-like putative cysteine protease